MKAIIVLLAIAMALVGSAAAWDSTNYLNYQYTKIVNTQAGEHLDWFGPTTAPGTTPVTSPSKPNDAVSSATFTSNGAYGTETATVANDIVDILATRAPYIPATTTSAAVYTDTHDRLDQFGSATVGTAAPDLENDNIIKFGTATAGEQLSLSGLYTNGAGDSGAAAQALFSNTASVGVDGITASSIVDRSDFPMTGEDKAFSAQIEAEGADIVDATLGQQTTVGFNKIAAIGAVPTLSGGVKNWASFDGAFGVDANGNPTGKSFDDVETSVANEQRFSLTFP